jgi:hypothetical protein
MVHSYAYNEDVCMQSMYSEFKHTLTFPSKLFVLPFSHEEFINAFKEALKINVTSKFKTDMPSSIPGLELTVIVTTVYVA